MSAGTAYGIDSGECLAPNVNLVRHPAAQPYDGSYVAGPTAVDLSRPGSRVPNVVAGPRLLYASMATGP